MDGLGQGYDVFVERLVSDFNASNALSKSPTSQNAENLSQHMFTGYSADYIGFPGSSNAFSVNREASSSSKQENAPVSVSTPPLAPNQPQAMNLDVKNVASEIPPRPRGHRRAQSEIAFRLPDDFSFETDFNLQETSAISDEATDDLFSMYVDFEKFNSQSATSTPMTASASASQPVSQPHHVRSGSVDRVLGSNSTSNDSAGPPPMQIHPGKPRHQHSLSMDGSVPIKDELITPELLETKKAMPPDKLAELALMDPKRAKRIIANRQSAARSKERKVRYISELERRVQTLQIEATTLSAQITILQRDTTELTTENNELRLRLQSMEQQAQLRDALSDALREEIQRLKVMTGLPNTGNGDTLHHPGAGQLHSQQFPQIQQQPQQSQLQIPYGFSSQTPVQQNNYRSNESEKASSTAFDPSSMQE